jgi:phage-related holin
MTLESLEGIAALIWSYPGVRLICLGVILNLAFSVAVAIRTGSFSFQVLADFLWKQLTPYVLVYFAAAMFAAGTDWQWIAPAVLSLIVVTLGASIIDKLRELGVPIPATVAALVANADDAKVNKDIGIDKLEEAAYYAQEREAMDDGR